MEKKVLIVEDDKEIGDLLESYLGKRGYGIRRAMNGMQAVFMAKEQKPDLMLLDIMLPLKSGDQVLKQIREEMDLPVIVISAKDMIQTKIDMLRLGADDYITKPFDLEEVLVRVETVLRRVGVQDEQTNRIVYKNLVLEKEAKRVKVKGQEIALTTKEYVLLELFLTYPDKMFSKTNLIESIWEEEMLYDDNALKVHISNLRSKLKKLDEEEYIETIWGMGYRLAK